MNAKVLVLDEPTAALGLRESATLLNQVEQLRDEGVGIILITHRLPDVLAIADQIAVMKHGEVHALLDPRDSDLEEIADIIVRGRRGPAMAGTGTRTPTMRRTMRPRCGTC